MHLFSRPCMHLPAPRGNWTMLTTTLIHWNWLLMFMCVVQRRRYKQWWFARRLQPPDDGPVSPQRQQRRGCSPGGWSCCSAGDPSLLAHGSLPERVITVPRRDTPTLHCVGCLVCSTFLLVVGRRSPIDGTLFRRRTRFGWPGLWCCSFCSLFSAVKS